VFKYLVEFEFQNSLLVVMQKDETEAEDGFNAVGKDSVHDAKDKIKRQSTKNVRAGRMRNEPVLPV
jgi:hypothetical protein